MTDPVTKPPAKTNAEWAAFALSAIQAGGVDSILAMLVKNLPGLATQPQVEGVSAEGRLFHKELPDMALHVEVTLSFVDLDPNEDHGPAVPLDDEGPVPGFVSARRTTH